MQIPEKLASLILGGALAHLATIDDDGAPHVTCAWPGIEGDDIVIATLFDQKKLQNMRRDPRVVLSFETTVVNDWGLKEYAVVKGTARVTEGGAPALLQELAKIHLGPDVVFPAMPDPPEGFITRISVDKVSGVGDWK